MYAFLADFSHLYSGYSIQYLQDKIECLDKQSVLIDFRDSKECPEVFSNLGVLIRGAPLAIGPGSDHCSQPGTTLHILDGRVVGAIPPSHCSQDETCAPVPSLPLLSLHAHHSSVHPQHPVCESLHTAVGCRGC